MNFQSALDYFVRHEGKVAHMYLDSVGLVTCAIGRMLPDITSAQSLPFVTRGTNVAAGPGTIGLEWQAVKAQEPDRVASYYEQFTMLDLPDAAIEADFAKSVDEFTATLRQRFPGFDSYPDAAQLGLLDMLYSMGPHRLFAGFPKFCQAVDAQDWASCAAESKRGGVSDQRNADCAALFKSAVIPT